MSLILNGTTATDVYLNGVKCTEAYLNGTKVMSAPVYLFGDSEYAYNTFLGNTNATSGNDTIVPAPNMIFNGEGGDIKTGIRYITGSMSTVYCQIFGYSNLQTSSHGVMRYPNAFLQANRTYKFKGSGSLAMIGSLLPNGINNNVTFTVYGTSYLMAKTTLVSNTLIYNGITRSTTSTNVSYSETWGYPTASKTVPISWEYIFATNSDFVETTYSTINAAEIGISRYYTGNVEYTLSNLLATLEEI